MISMRVVRKPRKEYCCGSCGSKITGTHLYLYGGEEYMPKPSGLRICLSCALNPENVTEEIFNFAILSLTQLVEIPSMEQHHGLFKANIRLLWICPVCGGPRGEIYKTPSFDGSLRMIVDGWKNDCGHVDKYSAVRKEALANGMNAIREVA